MISFDKMHGNGNDFIILNSIEKDFTPSKAFIKKSYWPNFLASKTFKNKNLKNLNYNGVSINTKTIKKNNLFL